MSRRDCQVCSGFYAAFNHFIIFPLISNWLHILVQHIMSIYIPMYMWLLTLIYLHVYLFFTCYDNAVIAIIIIEYIKECHHCRKEIELLSFKYIFNFSYTMWHWIWQSKKQRNSHTLQCLLYAQLLHLKRQELLKIYGVSDDISSDKNAFTATLRVGFASNVTIFTGEIMPIYCPMWRRNIHEI